LPQFGGGFGSVAVVFFVLIQNPNLSSISDYCVFIPAPIHLSMVRVGSSSSALGVNLIEVSMLAVLCPKKFTVDCASVFFPSFFLGKYRSFKDKIYSVNGILASGASVTEIYSVHASDARNAPTA